MVQLTDKLLDNLLPYLLQRASFLVTEQFHRHLKLNGVGVSRWRLLAWLSEFEQPTINELADILMLKQPSVTRLVDDAVRDGLVVKTGDTDDGRRVIVSLTAKGEGLVAQLKRDAVEAESRIEQVCDQRTLDQLKKNLADVIEQFDGSKYLRKR